MTVTKEQQKELKEILVATKDELMARHHDKFPSERPSVRGSYDQTCADMRSDLIIELFER